jgi:hypothetical protein
MTFCIFLYLEICFMIYYYFPFPNFIFGFSEIWQQIAWRNTCYCYWKQNVRKKSHEYLVALSFLKNAILSLKFSVVVKYTHIYMYICISYSVCTHTHTCICVYVCVSAFVLGFECNLSSPSWNLIPIISYEESRNLI